METKKEYPPPPKRDPRRRANINDLPPEQQQEILDAFMRLRINIGRAVLEANPGLEKIQ